MQFLSFLLCTYTLQNNRSTELKHPSVGARSPGFCELYMNYRWALMTAAGLSSPLCDLTFHVCKLCSLTTPPSPHLTLPFHTISFLLDGLGLWNSKALHGLVFLLLRLVLVRLVLVLAVRIDQHSAVERVTVPPWTLTGPWDAIHYRGARRENYYL